MLKQLTAAGVALLLAVAAHGQITDQFATGNMHFDAKAMDTNGDGKITKEEFRKYGESMWNAMAAGKDTIPVQQAAEDFARGNMKMNAKKMDTDHDGTISKSEFMTYAEHRFDRMKKSDGTISVEAAAEAFSRGNPHVASKSGSSASPR
jgi:hypothetical protein